MSNSTPAFLNVLVKRLEGKEADLGEDIENRSLNVMIVAASKTPYFQELYDANQHRNVIVVIPSGTKKLTKYAFMGCNNIKRVFIPSTVIEIEQGAFANCNRLTELMFETGCNLTIIGSKAFLGCTSLTSISNDRKVVHTYRYIRQDRGKECVLPMKLRTIGAEAFVDCGFNKIEFPVSLTEIGNGAFSNCNALETVDIPNIIIGSHAFMYCSGLTTVRFSNGVKNISNGMFAACRELSDITFPDTLERIEVGAFSTCTALKEIRFSEESKLHTIQDNGFISCDLLNTVVLPMSLETLGLRAFHGCDSLNEVYCSMKIFDHYLFIISDNRSQTHYHIHEVSRLGVLHNKVKKLKRLNEKVKSRTEYNSLDEKLMEPGSETANSIEIQRNMNGYHGIWETDEEIQKLRHVDRSRINALLSPIHDGISL